MTISPMSPPTRPRHREDAAPRRSEPTRLRHYAMTPADVLRRRVRHQPLDGHHPRRSTPTCAMRQWESLRQTYTRLGHTVDLVEPVAGLPDMVYAANGGLIVNGTAVVAQFALRRARRRSRRPTPSGWISHGYRPVAHPTRQRGAGRPAGRRVEWCWPATVFAPTAAPTTRSPRHVGHAGGQPGAGRPALLSPRHRAGRARRHHHRLLPAGLQRRAARARLRELFPDAIEVASADAYVLGLNAVSDGLHVVLPAPQRASPNSSATPASTPIGVDLSELLKGGGSVKCCTLEVYP